MWWTLKKGGKFPLLPNDNALLQHLRVLLHPVEHDVKCLRSPSEKLLPMAHEGRVNSFATGAAFSQLALVTRNTFLVCIHHQVWREMAEKERSGGSPETNPQPGGAA
jgi:hypothetical protein